jgi:hypothetical protein
MDIRAFFLGDDRTVPINYRHVLINPLKIDWPNFAMNYKEVITLAVDAFAADGNAFVTEYAGTSTIVNQFGLFDPAWNDKVFSRLEPVDVIDTLSSQNLVFCDFEFCQYNHPLLQGILLKYLPPPHGLSARRVLQLPRLLRRPDRPRWRGTARPSPPTSSSASSTPASTRSRSSPTTPT